MNKRHPVYPYNICYNGVIMENGFADDDTQLEVGHTGGSFTSMTFSFL